MTLGPSLNVKVTGYPGLDGLPSLNFLSAQTRQNPYPYYRELRRQDPVLKVGDFGWLVSRYQDVVFVLTNADLFSSSIMGKADALLLGSDPPRHTDVREIVNRLFFPERVAALEAAIGSITDALISRVDPRGEWELMKELATPLPVIVMAQALGIAPERCHDFKRWSQAVVVKHTGFANNPTPRWIDESIREFDIFFRGLIDQRRLSPGNDFISVLLNTDTPNRALTCDQVLGLSKLLLIAGSETTSNLIGNAVLALLRNKTELAKVKADPSLVPLLVEETLRYDAPVQFLVRRTTKAVVVSGVTLPYGARVVALVGSANRDETRFANPDTFYVSRDPRGHVAFGYGIHHCVGAKLARLEAKVVMQRLLANLPDFQATGDLSDIPLVDSIQLRGPRCVRLGPA